jgi:N-acylglucosamine-6-phosphate 2-epimerase
MGTTGTIVALAQCAEIGGAAGLRVDGAGNTAAVKAAVCLPIIAINKVVANGAPLITPDLEVIPTLVDAGASVVAIELSRRAYPDDARYRDALTRVRERWANRGTLLMADISTFDEGIAALSCGIDIVGTTLAGYTSYSLSRGLPDLDLVEQLAKEGVPVIAEGGYGRPEEAREAIRRGAWSVCVGTAITDPIAITRNFASALRPVEPGD